MTMKASLSKLSLPFFAACFGAVLGLSAQAATITINGTADSIPGGVGNSQSQNNIINSTNLPAGYGGFTGPSNGSGWFFNGSVTANVSAYQITWYFLGAESSNTNTFSSVAPLFTVQESNQNNNCCGGGTFNSLNPVAVTSNTLALIPLTLHDNNTNLDAFNGGLNGNSIMFAYVLPTTINGNPGWTVSTNGPTDWFAFGWNDNGADDLDFDDIMGLAHVTAVPGPLAGAGLPGLIFAGGGILAWWRRRRQYVQPS